LKVPPHSIEAEQSVLGGLMLDNERWDDVAERVVAEDFYTRPHRHIFTEMARLQESGSPIDLITLAESLERQGSWTASAVCLSGGTVKKHAKCGEHQRLCRYRARTCRCPRDDLGGE
jgi:replicative DNA helicase